MIQNCLAIDARLIDNQVDLDYYSALYRHVIFGRIK
jgi:hypothetical protein